MDKEKLGALLSILDSANQITKGGNERLKALWLDSILERYREFALEKSQ